MRYNSLRILYFGSDNISFPSFNKLCNNKLVSHLDLITTSLNKQATNQRLISCANKHNVNIYPLSKNMDFSMSNWQCPNTEYDIGVVVSFGYKIPSYIIQRFPLGVINIHPSLLPKYRGPSPIPSALLNGDTVTGVSTMKLSDKIDQGEICTQVKMSIEYDDAYATLAPKLANLGANMLNDLLANICSGIAHQTKSQSSFTEEPSYTKKFKATDATVQFSTMNSKQIYNQYRAFYGLLKTPLASKFRKKMMNIFEITPPTEWNNSTALPEPGTIIYNKEEKLIQVVCADGALIGIKSLGLQGKNRINGEDFYNGFLHQGDSILLN